MFKNNKSGISQVYLRLKLKETENQAIQRLIQRGWEIKPGEYKYDKSKRVFISE
jgi:hypothetical protein